MGIESIFGTAMVPATEALDPIAVLVHSARTRSDRHVEVLPRLTAFSESLAPRLEHPGVGALFEWWMMCGLGYRGSAPRAFSPAIDDIALPEPLRAAVNTLLQHRGDAGGVPILDWIVAQRAFEQALGLFRSKLHFARPDDAPSTPEHRTWADMMSEYQHCLDEFLAGRIPDDPNWKQADFKNFLKKSTLWGGSPLEKNYRARASEVADLATRAIELAVELEPRELHVPLRPVGRGNLDLVEASVRPIVELLLADLFDAEVDTEAPALTALHRGGELLPAVERNRLVTASVDWLAPTKSDLPAITPTVARYLRLTEAARAKRERGVDVDLVLLHLDDGHFNDAEQALNAIDEETRRRSMEADLQARCNSVERTLIEVNGEPWADEEWIALQLAEVNRIRGLIGQQERGELNTALTDLQKGLDAHRGEWRGEEAVRIVEELRLIGDVELHEAIERFADLADKGQLDADALSELEGLLDAERTQLHRRFDRLLGQFVELLYENEDQLPADLFREGQQLEYDANVVADDTEPDSGALVEMVQRLTTQRQRLENSVLRTWRYEDGEDELVRHIVSYVCERAGFTEFDVRRFHVALKSKRFLVLAGLTGTGKSTLARLYAESLDISTENEQYARIAVRPNWIDQSEVLGYINPINNSFQPGWLASMMLRCRRNPTRLHVCVLDEMNLAPVEQYLADVLSAIEEEGSGASPRVTLYPPDARPANRDEWQPTLSLPPNLFFVGTVNIDESTRALTDRVVDRGHMIQLSVTVGREHHREPRERLEPRWRVEADDWAAICSNEPDPSNHDFLISVAEVLQKMRIGMGIRTHIEIERFSSNAVDVMDPDEALDVAMLQRLVPKIRGYRRNLGEALEELLELCKDVGAERCERVIMHWLDESRSDDEYLDGTDPFLGVVTS
jgi:hypothetical protein